MSIVTKTGDKGKTSLYPRKRISKDDIRMEVCGELDELCSFLGLARSLVKDRKAQVIIEDIQSDIFVAGGEVACEAKYMRKLKRLISSAHIRRLDVIIAQFESRLPLKGRCFCLPGQNASAAIIDVTRAITRRIERRLVTLTRHGHLSNTHMLVYFNRLSDLLYLMARSLEKSPKKNIVP
jgi:cob(I)alamin adenosyltransferase